MKRLFKDFKKDQLIVYKEEAEVDEPMFKVPVKKKLKPNVCQSQSKESQAIGGSAFVYKQKLQSNQSFESKRKHSEPISLAPDVKPK